MTTWDGDDYQRRLDANLADAEDPHGEVAFVQRYSPDSVLDAGCGTGRVAIELDRRGVSVVGVDVDASMLATARRLAPQLTWVEHDLATLDLGRTFDVVVMAGNVLVFTAPGTQAEVIAGCARHLTTDGFLVAGFQLSERYPIERYDAETEAAGLELVERYATWHLDPFTDASDYAVSVHRGER
jgi:SAM-dependent methyltransferase